MLVREFFDIFFFDDIHLLLEAIAGSLQDMLDFRNRDNREEFGEQEITGKE